MFRAEGFGYENFFTKNNTSFLPLLRDRITLILSNSWKNEGNEDAKAHRSRELASWIVFTMFLAFVE